MIGTRQLQWVLSASFTIVSGYLHRAGEWRFDRTGTQNDIAFHLVGSEQGRPGSVLLTLPG
jgi:hypothetical protein